MPDRKIILLVQSRMEFQLEYTHRPYLPLSLLSVARCLVPEWDVRILDERLESGWRWWKSLEEALKSRPVCVGITSLTGRQLRHSLAISRFVKARTDAPVVWGGPHASLLPEQTLENEAIDFVVQGEGEHVFRDLVTALATGGDPFAIEGVWGKAGSRIRGRVSGAPVDLETLPPMPYALVDLERYLTYRGVGGTIPVETSRGCPMGCRFCHSSSRPEWRGLSPAKTVEGIEELSERHGVRSLFLVDQNFFVDMGRVNEIFRRLVERNLGVSMETQGLRASDVVDRMDEGFLALMKRAGMLKLDIGAESGSERLLDFIGKGIEPGVVLAANRKLARHGFLTKFNFIVGLPTETDGETRQTIDLAFRVLEENPMAQLGWIHVYATQPGTPLHLWEVEHGLAPPRNLEDWAAMDGQTGRGPRKKLLEAIFFTSHFMRIPGSYFFRSRAVPVLLSLYRPIALFRLRRFFFAFLVEWAIARSLMLIFGRWTLWILPVYDLTWSKSPSRGAKGRGGGS